MRAWMGGAVVLVLCGLSTGCASAGVFGVPKVETAAEAAERQRQQDLVRALHGQAMEAHENAVRMHQEMQSPPTPPR
jgi:hypothetical protein